MSAAVAWDPKWNLHAPLHASVSNYATWRRRVQAFLEAESVWEVVSESVVFDDTWPLPKQLEFIQKDKLGVHLLLTTLHDAVLHSIDSDECNRSWLIVKHLEALFAAHRMKAVRSARRDFLGLKFQEFVNNSTSGSGGSGEEEEDAMQRFVAKVQQKADTLFRLQGRPGHEDASDDEKMYQLLDALPETWTSFVVQECESRADLTWQSLQRKVLLEYSKRCDANLRRRLLQQGSSNSTPSITAVNVTTASTSRSNVVAAGTQVQEQPERNTLASGGGADSAYASPVLMAKTEPSNATTAHFHQHQENHYDLRSDEESMPIAGAVYDFVGQQPPPHHLQQHQDQYQQQQQYHHPQDHQQQQYDHPRRNRNPHNPRNANRRDPRTPYGRPPHNSTQKTCFYCAQPGHTAHQCPLKRMHMDERKKNSNLP